MTDKWTQDYFAPLGEPASLFGNDVTHLDEPPVRLPDCKIGAEPDRWPAFAADVAALHADREPACECGACRYSKRND